MRYRRRNGTLVKRWPPLTKITNLCATLCARRSTSVELDETTIPFVTPEARSTRQTRCISIAPVLFEKKKKKKEAANPLLTSLDLRARSEESLSPLSLEFINVALHTPVKLTNSFLFILINLSPLYIKIEQRNFQTCVKTLHDHFSLDSSSNR